VILYGKILKIKFMSHFFFPSFFQVFNGSNNFGMLNPDGTGFDPQQQQYWGQMLPN
jgi:hypothetical protein